MKLNMTLMLPLPPPKYWNYEQTHVTKLRSLDIAFYYIFNCLFGVCPCVFVCGHLLALVHMRKAEDNLQDVDPRTELGSSGLTTGTFTY